MADVSDRVSEITTSAHLMRLEPGLYCAHTGGGAQPTDAASGLPDVRISRAPGPGGEGVALAGLGPDGLVGDGAVVIRVAGQTASVLITIYQRPGAAEPAPNLQIQRLDAAPADATRPAAVARAAGPARPAAGGGGGARAGKRVEVGAHIQRRGDVGGPIGQWVGEPGSQRWIEGFSLLPEGVAPTDLEYQAVLGRGWLSPWVEGGQYCGSRGMALPILGLRVRLKNRLADERTVRIEASFTDGSRRGPVDGSEPCEAESLAPLEAFRIILDGKGAGATADAAPARATGRSGRGGGTKAAAPVAPPTPAGRGVAGKSKAKPAATRRPRTT